MQKDWVELQLLTNYTYNPALYSNDWINQELLSKENAYFYKEFGTLTTKDSPFEFIQKHPELEEMIFEIYGRLPALAEHKHIVNTIIDKYNKNLREYTQKKVERMKFEGMNSLFIDKFIYTQWKKKKSKPF
jgi:hypothetical protein